jgi:hypothetical protein
MQTAIAITNTHCCQIPQAHPQRRLVLRLAPVAQGGTRHVQDAARPPLAHLKADLELLHQFPLPGRR